jgi:pimeloyl-ACP methyl ester carboxylesterase
MSRGYVTLANGQSQVHYRRAGIGPPIVLVHASPGSSLQLEPLMRLLTERGRTAIAPDTAGFGQSDPLPDDERPSAADYASVLGEALDALGLRSFDVYGTHTGAKIALELALARPNSVRSLLLDGVGMYTPEEQARQLAYYTPSLAPEWDGTHLVRAWNLRRDMALFWPWYDQTSAGRRCVGVPSAQALHAHVVDILRGGDRYRGGYYAAFSHDTRGALPRLTVPTRIVFRQSDVITEHAARLPPLPDCVSVEILAADAAIIDRLASTDGAGSAPAVPHQQALSAPRLTRDYVTTSIGQIHVRRGRGGGQPKRPVVLLHGSPRSSASLEGLATALAEDRHVLAIDTPGYGDSDKPTWPDPDHSLEPFARVIAEVIQTEASGGSRVDVFGTHTGAALALELARIEPEMVGSLVLHGLPIFDDAERADLLQNYFVSLEPRWDGSHLVTAWHLCRNLLLFWPWYRQEPGATLRNPLNPETLHRDTVDLLKAGLAYAWAYAAAFRYDARLALTALQTRAALAFTQGDPLEPHLARAQAVRPDLPILEVPGPSSPNQQAAAAKYRAFLDTDPNP